MVAAGHCACSKSQLNSDLQQVHADEISSSDKIQFEIDASEAELSNGALCHCNTCYHAHSGPSFNMKLDTSAIKIVKGEVI
jgi:hypothetical protein